MNFSCRNAVVEVIEKSLDIKLDKKIEVDSGDELTEAFIHVGKRKFLDRLKIFLLFQSELHPVVSLNRQKFAKPPGPSRGNKRLTKTPA